MDATGCRRKSENVARLEADTVAMRGRRSTTSHSRRGTVTVSHRHADIQANIRTRICRLAATRTNCRPAKCIDFAAAPTKLRFRVRAAVIVSSFSHPCYGAAPARNSMYTSQPTEAKNFDLTYPTHNHLHMSVSVTRPTCLKDCCIYYI